MNNMKLLIGWCCLAFFPVVAAAQKQSTHTYKTYIEKAEKVVMGNQTIYDQRKKLQNVQHNYYQDNQYDQLLFQLMQEKTAALESMPANDPARPAVKKTRDSLHHILQTRINQNTVIFDFFNNGVKAGKPIQTGHLQTTQNTDSIRQFIVTNQKTLALEYQRLIISREKKEKELSLIDQRLKDLAGRYLILSDLAKTRYLDSLNNLHAIHSLTSYEDGSILQKIAEQLENSDPAAALQYYYLLLRWYGIRDGDFIRLAGSVCNLPDTMQEIDNFLQRRPRIYDTRADRVIDSLLYARIGAQMQFLSGKICYNNMQWDSAIHCFNLNLKSLAKQGIAYNSDLGNTYSYLAYTYQYKGDRKKAVDYLELCLYNYYQMAWDSSYSPAIYMPIAAQISEEIGDLAQKDRDWDRALGSYNFAETVYRVGLKIQLDSFVNLPKIARMLLNKADMRFMRSGENVSDTVIREQQEALQMYETLDKMQPDVWQEDLGYTQNLLGTYYVFQEKTDSALHYYNKALLNYSLIEKKNSGSNLSTQLFILKNQLAVCKQTSILGDSIPMLHQLHTLYKQIGEDATWEDTESLLLSLNSLALLTAKQDKIAQAIRILEQATALCDSLPANASYDDLLARYKSVILENLEHMKSINYATEKFIGKKIITYSFHNWSQHYFEIIYYRS